MADFVIKERTINFPNVPVNESVKYIKCSLVHMHGAHFLTAYPAQQVSGCEQIEITAGVRQRVEEAPRYSDKKLQAAAAKYAQSSELAALTEKCAKVNKYTLIG